MKQPKKILWVVIDPDGDVFEVSTTKPQAVLLTQAYNKAGGYYDPSRQYTIAKYKKA